MLFVNTF